MLLVGAAGSAWGDEVYKTALFGADYNPKNTTYTTTFDATNESFVVTVTNFNNNNNGWTNSSGNGQIKCGRKGSASTGVITTKAPIDKAVTKVVVTIDAITSAKVNSISLYKSSNSTNWTYISSFSKSTGDQTVAISSPAENLYYKIEFNCESGTSNGLVTISKIEYYYTPSSTTETVATPTFTPAAGTYTSAQNVTISTATDGATIYYTTDGTDPTTSSSVYNSAIAVNSTTAIKAMAVKEGMDNSVVATAEYTIVNLEHAGTEADPYTVSDARTAIDANTGITNVYATGIVSGIVTAYNSQYGNISFDFVDSEGDANTLRAYRCSGEEAANVQVGDIVVVAGNLTKYNSTYEFGEGCTLVSRTSSSTKVAADLAFSPTTASADLANLSAFTAPTLTNPHSLAVTYSSSNTEVATVAADGTVTILAEGTTTITASSEETEQYLAGTASYRLTVTSSNKQLVTVDAAGNVTFDLTDNGWEFPTSKTIDEGQYTADGYTIILAGGGSGNGHSFNSSGYLIMGKSGATLTLPAFDFPVEKIEVVGRDGASAGVIQNIYVGETAVSTATTGATGTNTYNIAAASQAAGTIYTLKVTSSHNTQITSIKVYKGKVDEREDARITFSTETLTITQGKDYTAPTFSNPNNVSVTFSSDNVDVATWNNGFVLGTATGTAVITANFDGNDNYKPATATLTVTVKENLNFVDVVIGNGIYEKVTSDSQLEAGKRYLIVYENESSAIIFNGKNGNNNYGAKVDGTIADNKIDNTGGTVTHPVVLQNAGSGNWYLMDGDNFLYWSSGNNLYWGEEISTNGNTWTINVDNGQIINATTIERRLQYNTGSPRFACYTGTQKDVVLYKELTSEETISITISAAGYSTLYYGTKNLVVPEGMEAYTVKVTTQVERSTIYNAGDVIPAGTGVVLKADEKTYEFAVTAEAGTQDENNMLRGNDVKTTTTGGTYYYALTLDKNHQNPGFYWMVAGGGAYEAGAHKAYLALDKKFADLAEGTETGVKGFLALPGDGIVTGIEAMDNGQWTMDNAEIYNLAGQRVKKMQKGIYVVGGKKVMVK